jgi:hypothetical protein
MHLLRLQLENIIVSEALALFFEQKDKVIGRIVDDFDDILAEDRRGQLGPIVVGTKKQLPLLQVADFLVYEFNTGLDDFLHSSRPVRPALKRLMEPGKVHYVCHEPSAQSKQRVRTAAHRR